MANVGKIVQVVVTVAVQQIGQVNNNVRKANAGISAGQNLLFHAFPAVQQMIACPVLVNTEIDCLTIGSFLLESTAPPARVVNHPSKTN